MTEIYGNRSKMEVRSIMRRQCRKKGKTEAHKCIPYDKLFHPDYVKLHKVYNTNDKLIPCTEKTEVFMLKSGLHGSDGIGGLGSEKDLIVILRRIK